MGLLCHPDKGGSATSFHAISLRLKCSLRRPPELFMIAPENMLCDVRIPANTPRQHQQNPLGGAVAMAPGESERSQFLHANLARKGIVRRLAVQTSNMQERVKVAMLLESSTMERLS